MVSASFSPRPPERSPFPYTTLFRSRSNTLIIRDIPSVIPVIDNLRAQLDRKSQQVEIEARVVSASRSFAEDIGTELGFAGATTGGRSLFGGDPSVGCSGVTGVVPSPVVCGQGTGSGNGITSGTPLNTFLSAGTPSSAFSFSHRSPNFALDFFITMAEAKGVGKLLSKPKVITQNNEKATVKQGTKIPIQTTINKDRKSTRLNSSHTVISYAVFCLKKKKKKK